MKMKIVSLTESTITLSSKNLEDFTSKDPKVSYTEKDGLYYVIVEKDQLVKFGPHFTLLKD